MKTAERNQKTLQAQKFLGAGAAFFGAILLCVATMGVALPVEDTHADRITLRVNNVGYYAQLNSTAAASGLNFNITPNSAVSKKTDTLTVKTNAKNGYKVYISTQGSDNNLKLQSAPSGLTTEQSNIRPTNTSAITANTWGYSVNNGSTWQAVPIKGSEAVIKSSAMPNNQGSGTTFNIDYGVAVDARVVAGTYSNKVVYTMVADATTSTFKGSTAPNRLALAGGQINVTVPLYANYNLTANDVQVTVGGTPCTNLAIASQDKNKMVIRCTAPAKSGGSHAVKVNIPKAGSPVEAGAILYE